MYRSMVYLLHARHLDRAELTPRPAILGACTLFFAIVLFVHCPATILHPEFWAEDGVIWYSDVYIDRLTLLVFSTHAIFRLSHGWSL